MTQLEKIELAVRRARDRHRNMPSWNMDVIQVLDFLAEELAKIGRAEKEDRSR